jgi:hypothetical protein
MSSKYRSGGVWALGLGVLGLGAMMACSSAPTPPADVATTPPATTEIAGEEEVSGPLTPAAAPAELFLVGRIANPAQFVDVLSGWVHIPIPLDVLVDKALPSLRKQLTLNAPVEVAMTLDPDALGEAEPLMAASLPLKDYGAAVAALREQGIPVERINRDMYAVDLPDGQSCALGRANGTASARLVCGDQRHDVDVLAPYMVRTLPVEPLTPAALYVEVRAEPLRKRFGKQAHLLKVGVPVLLREISIGNARFDAAVADAVHSSASELLALLDEADKLVIKATTGTNKEALQFDIGLKLNGARSWSSSVLNARAKDSAIAPELVWRLPGDVTTGGYSASVGDAKLWQPVLENLAEIMGGGLDYLDLDARPYQELVAAFRDLGAMVGPSAFGQGTEPEAAKQSALAAEHFGDLGAAIAPGSYGIGGIEGDGSRFKRLLDAAVGAFNDPAWRKGLSKRAERPALTKLPTVTRKAAPAELGLPKGSLAYELSLTNTLAAELQGETEKPATKGTLTFHALLVSEGTRTWLAYGLDRAQLATKLKQVLSGSADGSLGARPGLEAWRKEAAVTAGFWTVSELFEVFARYANAAAKGKGDGPTLSRDTLTLAVPSKGKTPVRYAVKVEPGPTLWMSFVAPGEAMEDLAAGTVAAMAQMGDIF